MSDSIRSTADRAATPERPAFGPLPLGRLDLSRLRSAWLLLLVVVSLLLALALPGLSLVTDARAVQATAAAPPRPVRHGPAPLALAPAAPVYAHTVVLVVLDGIRWQEIYFGVDAKLAPRHGMSSARVVPAERLLPALTRLRTERGAAVGAPGTGAPMHATGPVYRSLPGYMELLTGLPARYCRSNRCGNVRHPTLMDQIATRQGNPRDAALFASWPHLIHAAAMHPERAVISTGRRDGSQLELVYATPERAEFGKRASAAGASPSKGDFRADRFTASLALDYLLSERPRFLFISLGEADVYGHANNYPAYLAALRHSDAFVGELMTRVEALNREAHRTTLLVTTDHGRDAHAREHGPEIPESARIWLMAAGFGVAERGSIASPKSRSLSDVAPSVQRLLGLPLADPGSGLTEVFRFPGPK